MNNLFIIAFTMLFSLGAIAQESNIPQRDPKGAQPKKTNAKDNAKRQNLKSTTPPRISRAFTLYGYKAIRIGKQVWMQKNLDVERFQNGNLIPKATTQEEWDKASKDRKPAWCYYDFDDRKGKKYGKLYNYYAVHDSVGGGLSPEGWHIPTEDEWKKLIKYLGGEQVAGKKMKSTSGWELGTEGNNSSGFSALPGGEQIFSGCRDLDEATSWWTTTLDNIRLDSEHRIEYPQIPRYSLVHLRVIRDGYYVRCVKD